MIVPAGLIVPAVMIVLALAVPWRRRSLAGGKWALGRRTGERASQGTVFHPPVAPAKRPYQAKRRADPAASDRSARVTSKHFTTGKEKTSRTSFLYIG
jgi:hypothetical protein